jgi:hypothetical protein
MDIIHFINWTWGAAKMDWRLDHKQIGMTTYKATTYFFFPIGNIIFHHFVRLGPLAVHAQPK